MKSIAEQIFDQAHQIAKRTLGFQERKGPGKNAGNGATNEFLRLLNQAVTGNWPSAVRQQEPVAPGLRYSFDYFIPLEETAVEIALSLRNIVTEFEKDIFKAILANEAGKRIKRLVLIGKVGSVKRQSQPGPSAIKAWVKQHCGVDVVVKELL